ncbi:MAG: MFS transporter [Pirellulales bacterium]|nr:MFS transporter [Pirellulales bacterium]
MDSTVDDPSPPPLPPAAHDWPVHPEIEPQEPRNLLLLAVQQIVLRVGWIFKTESVIIPAFLDWLAGPGAGVLRGCLPVLNRFGQSVPPVLCANRLGAMRRKKRALAGCVLMMSLPFAVLSIVCLIGDARRLAWMPQLFLGLYGLFFIFNGLYHLSFGTVQGKLIRPTRRGRLLLISTFAGTIPAILFAWWLLDDWLALPDGGFGYAFGFTAVCFFLSGLTVLLVFEPDDDPPPKSGYGGLASVADTLGALRRDHNLRRLVLVAMLFGSSLIIFPHYQTLARVQLGLYGPVLMVWVVAQNAAVGMYSLLAGPLADAWGNRLTLRTLILGSAAAPLLAIAMCRLGPTGAMWFWTVFIALGGTPLVLRILNNYALEICEPAEHPRYLSTLSLCLAVPFLLSPAVGWAVDRIGFEPVFLSTSGLILLGGGMTFRLEEPRHRRREAEIVTLAAGGEE